MMQEIMFLFLLYAIIGWLWETPFVSIKEGKYINRGFLRGPYIPIYGFSCISIILVLNALNFHQDNHPLIILVQIIIISLISVVWEYGTSWVLEKLFKQRWWDYSYKKYNLQGRITLDFTILFGIGGFLLWRFVNPVLLSLYSNLEGQRFTWIMILIFVLFITDSIFTLSDLIRVKKFMTKFTEVKDNLLVEYNQLMSEMLNDFKTSKHSIKSKLDQLKKSLNAGSSKRKSQMLLKASELEQFIRFSCNTKRLYSKFPRLSVLKLKKEKINKSK